MDKKRPLTAAQMRKWQDDWEKRRALDVLVAEKVLGRVVDQKTRRMEKLNKPEQMEDIPPYSSDLSAAWLIMDHFKPGRADPSIQEDQAAFLVRARFVDALDNMYSWWSWTANRLSLAICQAALKAVGYEEKEEKNDANTP